MPRIDELAPAPAASDTDLLPASQNGIVRRLSRGQLLAGVQTQIALPHGALLGRAGPGSGPVEPILLGANLALAGNVLSAAAPYSLASLPAGRPAAPGDAVPVLQGGADALVGYGPFMAGLAGIGGIDLSRHLAAPAGARGARPLADLLADAVTVESFGAAGDGVTDDTAALAAAAASGRPVRLGGRAYVVNGQWTISTPTTLLGVPGVTTLLRRSQPAGGGAWIAVTASSFRAEGIIFDANRAAVPAQSWGVLVTPGCVRSEFHACGFANAGGAVIGCGLAIQPSDPTMTQHVVRDCEAWGNALHGIWVQAVDGALMLGCRAHDNGGDGLRLDWADPAGAQRLRLAQVVNNRCWRNGRGIAVGAAGLADVAGALLANNTCHDNALWGIAVAGASVAVQNNQLLNNGTPAYGGGILAAVSSSRIGGNLVGGAGAHGINVAGSTGTEVCGNSVAGAGTGIAPGGTQHVAVTNNRVQDCNWAITVNNLEGDGSGAVFPAPTADLAITGNRIGISAPTGGGVRLLDAPRDVVVAGNLFTGTNGASVAQALWAHTDAVVVEGNRWNNARRVPLAPVATAAGQQLQVPDIADGVTVTAAPGGVQSVLFLRAAAMQGALGFVRLAAGGSGYTRATVAISGDGTGAAASAVVANGAVVGITVTSPGSGYTTATATVGGDGAGASAVAVVGLPVPDERRLRLFCTAAVRLSAVAAANWTGADITAPALTQVDLLGASGGWRAVAFAPGDYLSPTGNGGVVLRTVPGGDLTLRPAGSGRVHLASDADPAGCLLLTGHGAPEGVVAAPPGSDYRNLDGGVGGTLWIKRAGTGPTGWYALA